MIKFTKMHGLGNDYVYIDCVTNNLYVKDIRSLALFVSDRHFGIGSDGLILICKSDVADFKMRMFNSDGTEAEMCGNGIRCVGKFVYEKNLTTKTKITVETLSGIKYLELNVKNKKVETVTVDMEQPIFDASKIPVIYDRNITDGIDLEICDRKFRAYCVSMGNPHTIIEVEDIDSFDIEKYGPILENDKHFPNKTNVEFINIINKSTVKMRVWERGSGETYACGTGACAVAATCILRNLTGENITVELLGGNLQIEWKKQNNHIYMTGPAETVFEGEFEYDKN